MAGLEQYERRVRTGNRLLLSIGLVCAALLVGGLLTGESWIAKWSLGVFALFWLTLPYIFDRCPQCRRFVAEHHRDPDRWEPCDCPRCGARLRE